MDNGKWERIIISGSASEMKEYLSEAEAGAPPGYLDVPDYRTFLRTGATPSVTTGNMDMLRYFCKERCVPVNFIPPDELLFEDPDAHNNTPLLVAVSQRQEDMVSYLLSLPRDENSPPLNLNARFVVDSSHPSLTMAAKLGLVRAVKAFWGLDVDLLARDLEGHLAVCRAVRACHVEVVNVFLEAHAIRRGDIEAIVERPC